MASTTSSTTGTTSTTTASLQSSFSIWRLMKFISHYIQFWI
ncbi:hypothetical protein LINPERPRIM_LOCUS26564 [Linum perenne]